MKTGEGKNGKGVGTRKNSELAAAGEGTNRKGEGIRGRAAKSFDIPRGLMRAPEDEDE